MPQYTNVKISKSSPASTNSADNKAALLAATGLEDEIRYKIFCTVWAIATLFHMAQSRIYTSTFHTTLLTIAAIAVIIKPESLLRLLILIAIQLYEVAFSLPHISNHWIFTALVNLTIIQALVYLIFKEKTFHINKKEFLNTFAPSVRIELIILYFFVVLHKLNWDFFSPDFSCATVLYKAQHSESLLPRVNSLFLASIYSTIIIETLIPILLIFQKTRNAGLLLGLCFHCIIGFNSFNGFYDFSSMIFAVYFLYTSKNFSHTVQNIYSKLVIIIIGFKQRFDHFSFTNFFILLAIILSALFFIKLLSRWFNDYFYILWAAYSLAFILLFILHLTNYQKQIPISIFKLPNLLFLFFPVLVFFNGICPYLGLKTEYSFAMFSNLRTEGGKTNHFFIPITTQVFNFQNDMVEILSSSDPSLQRIASKGKLITFFEFKNTVANSKPKQLVYIRNGNQFSFDATRASASDELMHKSPLLQRKLLSFRQINKTGPQSCSH